MKLENIPGISEARLKALHQSAIFTTTDLINLFPRRFLDRRNVLQINHLAGRGEEVTVIGVVTNINQTGFGKKSRLEVIISDDTGTLKGVWFKGVSFYKKVFKTGQLVAFFGNVKRYGRFLTIAHPDVEKLADESDIDRVAALVPIYPSTNFFKKTYITSTLLNKWIKKALEDEHFEDFLPDYLRNELELPERNIAYRMVHSPESKSEYLRSLKRFKFEELFLFQLSMAKLKHRVKERHSGITMEQMGDYTHRFFNEILPFELTDGQKNALTSIKRDLRSGIQMNRLIQGDVGAGKTVVAIGAILMTLDNGYQTAFMAPTEILAEQHYRTLSEYLKTMGINTRLLVGSQNASLRRDILTDIQAGTCQIVIGTHAIIQKEVQFGKLGMVVIDEQHRFGVLQRAVLLEKGDHPHIMVMSATPIPRSLALTLYGDLDVSIIRGLPHGRKPIKTAVRGESKRESVYSFIEEVINEGGQIYIVYPLVEESEVLDLKDATMGFEHITARFPNTPVGLLHGRMKSDEKDDVMRSFIKNELKILVSTTVIEVGVDVPNASVMIVEHAERFGLSQLHQLRGRIGRGSRQSYCILMTDVKKSKEAKIRLDTMEKTNDGFQIAEVDLKLRGPGDFLGTKQSGIPEFKFADILEDQEILELAKEKAMLLINDDPEFEKTEHQKLKATFEPYFQDKSRFYQMT